MQHKTVQRNNIYKYETEIKSIRNAREQLKLLKKLLKCCRQSTVTFSEV